VLELIAEAARFAETGEVVCAAALDTIAGLLANRQLPVPRTDTFDRRFGFSSQVRIPKWSATSCDSEQIGPRVEIKHTDSFLSSARQGLNSFRISAETAALNSGAPLART
jgi:hypothetical protein